MVQRKVINKLADHLKIDVKNGSMELKKMKKSELDRMPQKPSSPPNYMKSTSSSDARKEKTTVSIKTPKKNKNETKTFARSSTLKMASIASFKPARAKKRTPVAISENFDVKRATCSSTMKDHKFPTYLTLTPGATESEGISSMKVCPYTYCSLNGHHPPPLPPLKGFMSARRRALKTNRSIKLGCLSPRSTKPTKEILKFEDPLIQEKDDFFIEIYTPDKESIDEIATENHDHEESRELDSEGSDENFETDQYPAVYLDDDYEYPCTMEKEGDLEGVVAGKCALEADFIKKIDSCFTECLADDASQESFDEDSLSSDAWSSSDDCETIPSFEYPEDASYSAAIVNLEQESVPEYTHASIRSLPIVNTSAEEIFYNEFSIQRVTSTDELQISNSEAENVSNQDEDIKTSTTMSPEKEAHTTVHTLDNAEMKDGALNRVQVKCKKLTEDSDELGEFNPRGPNFLLLEPDPDAENIDLRHQELDERKNAEEWMVDFALRQVVTKLGPARKKKVSLLVEAFEKVMPVTKYDIHMKHNSAFDHVRPIQACN